jgi:hypothetical protein
LRTICCIEGKDFVQELWLEAMGEKSILAERGEALLRTQLCPFDLCIALTALRDALPEDRRLLLWGFLVNIDLSLRLRRTRKRNTIKVPCCPHGLKGKILHGA